MTQRIQAALRTGELADQDLVFTNLLLELIKKDLLAAANLAKSLAVSPTREDLFRRAAQLWTAQDPASAKHWAEQLSNTSERNTALTNVCFQIAQTGPHQATQMTNQYGLRNQSGAPLNT